MKIWAKHEMRIRLIELILEFDEDLEDFSPNLHQIPINCLRLIAAGNYFFEDEGVTIVVVDLVVSKPFQWLL